MRGCVGLALVVACVFFVSPGPADAQSGSDAEAHALFEAGQHAYADGRFEQALDYFTRAYEISHRALLLYNIGSAAEHLRHDQQALDAFRRYLVELPDAENRQGVEARITILEGSLAAASTQTTTEATTQTTTTETTTSETPVTTSSGDSDPTVAFVLLGVGAAVAVAGAVLVGVGFADGASVSGAADGATWPSLSGAYERAPILEGVGFATLGVGVAVAVTGIVVLATGGSSSTGATAWVDDQGAGVAIGGQF